MKSVNPLVPNWMYPANKLVYMRDTGAIERRDPLPVGSYWVDAVGEEQIKQFEDWIAANVGVAGIVTSEQTNDSPKAFWYLFKVTGGPNGQFLPIWSGPGRPNIAEPGVKQSSDTVREPDISNMGFLDLIGITPGMQKSLGLGSDVIGNVIIIGMFLGGGLLTYKLVSSFSSSKRN